MKNKILSGLLVLALFAFGSSGLAADFKIATVDLRKVYYTYYKTVQAMIAVSNNVVQRDKQLNDMIDERKKREDDWRQAVGKANDMGISADQRAKSKKDADDIAFDLTVRNETISNFYARTELERREKMDQRANDLTTEIRGVMDAMAKRQGYTMVLDRTALTMTGYPLVLYTSGENDLTEALLKELNSTAPAAPAPETNNPAATPRPPATGARPPPATPPPK
jgi:Skp family chaperone for outer membrane proteins